MTAKLKDFLESEYTTVDILSNVVNNYWLNNQLQKSFDKPILIAPSPVFLVTPRKSVAVETITTDVVVPFKVISDANSIGFMDYVIKALEEVYPPVGDFYLYEVSFPPIDYNNFFGDRAVNIRGVVHDS